MPQDVILISVFLKLPLQCSFNTDVTLCINSTQWFWSIFNLVCSLCFAWACRANVLAFCVENVDDPWFCITSNKLIMHEHAFSRMCSTWIPCHTFHTATAASREARCHFLSQKVRPLARLIDVFQGKTKQNQKTGQPSCQLDFSFLIYVLPRLFMSDVPLPSIPTSLKMEFMKKKNGRSHFNCLLRLWRMTDNTLMQRITQVQVFALHQLSWP